MLEDRARTRSPPRTAPPRTRPTGDAVARARATSLLSPDEQRERAKIKKAKLQLKDDDPAPDASAATIVVR